MKRKLREVLDVIEDIMSSGDTTFFISIFLSVAAIVMSLLRMFGG